MSRQYFALISLLAEVVHWEAIGEVYDDCKSQAAILLEELSARHSALMLGGDHDGPRLDGETETARSG